MRSDDAVIDDIIRTFEAKGMCSSRHRNFRFLRRTSESVIVERENGNEVRIPFAVLRTAIDAIRSDHTIYSGGPNRLRECGITHINSPTWALVRLLTLDRLID